MPAPANFTSAAYDADGSLRPATDAQRAAEATNDADIALLHEALTRTQVAPAGGLYSQRYTGTDTALRIASFCLERALAGVDDPAVHATWDEKVPQRAGFTRELVARLRSGALADRSIYFGVRRTPGADIAVVEEDMIELVYSTTPTGRRKASGWRCLTQAEALETIRRKHP